MADGNDTVSKIAAIILAAGESSRFGKPKPLLQLHHKSLVRRIIGEAQAANCGPIIVVTGNAHDKVKDDLRNDNVIIARNENWRGGIGTSIRTGVQLLFQIRPEIDGVVLLVCDQPLVDASTIRSLIDLRETTRKAIVASRYAETLGVPAIFDRSCFHELAALGSDSGAKAIILSNPDRVAAFGFPDGAVDIDTAEDYENFRDGRTS